MFLDLLSTYSPPPPPPFPWIASFFMLLLLLLLRMHALVWQKLKIKREFLHSFILNLTKTHTEHSSQIPNVVDKIQKFKFKKYFSIRYSRKPKTNPWDFQLHTEYNTKWGAYSPESIAADGLCCDRWSALSFYKANTRESLCFAVHYATRRRMWCVLVNAERARYVRNAAQSQTDGGEPNVNAFKLRRTFDWSNQQVRPNVLLWNY